MTGNTRNKLQVLRHSQCGPVSGSGSGDSSDVWGKAGDSCGDGARVSWPSSPRLAQLLAPAILSISASHRQLVAGGQPVLCVICDSRDPCTHPVWHRGHDTCHHQPRVFSRQVRHVQIVVTRGPSLLTPGCGPRLDYCESEPCAWAWPTFASHAVWIFPDHDSFPRVSAATS